MLFPVVGLSGRLWGEGVRERKDEEGRNGKEKKPQKWSGNKQVMIENDSRGGYPY